MDTTEERKKKQKRIEQLTQVFYVIKRFENISDG